MGLTFPRDLILEMYLGRWLDFSTLAQDRSLRQDTPVTVTWGRSGEQTSKTPPSFVEAELNNTGGHWTPGNPMSDYADYLQGRNVPCRLSLRTSVDRFAGRASGFSWLTSDTGELWQSASSGSGSVSVGGGFGSHLQPNAGAFILSYFSDVYGDAQVAATARWNFNVAGGALEPLNLVLRWQPSGAFATEHYLLRISVSTAEVVTVAIYHSTLGLISQSPVTFGTLTPGLNFLRAKFQAEGQMLRGKVYAAGPNYTDRDIFEPLDWQVTAHHDRLTGGYPGIRTGVAAGNINIPVTVDYVDWDLRLVRHTGELARLEPTWDESHRIKKAKLRIADITQRLGRPQRADLASAPRRYLAANAEFATTDHWPLDESAAAAAQGLSTTGGQPAVFLRETGVTPNRGAITWGADDDDAHPAVPACAEMNNGGRLLFTVNQAPLGSSYSIMWAMRLAPDAGAQIFISTAATASRFVFFCNTDGTYSLFSNPSGGTISSGVLVPGGLDGQWVTLGITVFPTGGNADARVFVNGESRGGGLIGADPAYSPASSVLFHVPQPSTGGQGDTALSSMFVTATRFDIVVGSTMVGGKAHTALLGWRGETAGNRAFRLAAEEGVPFDYWGDLGNTRTMGPQRPIPLLDQFQECVDADQGFLYAPRYTAGVGFRPRRTMCVTQPTATLNYAAGQVAAPLAPSADDRPTANLIRAEMTDGQFVTLEQTTGPMNTRNPGTDSEAVGKSPARTEVNVEAAAQLPDVAGWERALGTTPEVRFPQVTVNMRARELDVTAPTTARSVLQVGAGDRLVVSGLAAADVYRELDQVALGGVETFSNVRQHKVRFNTAPYEKYRSGVYDDSGSRYDGAVTTLDAQLTSGTTGARNVTTSSGPVWTTDAGAFPMLVLIGGELVTLSGITGAGTAAQVMTISARNGNGLPISGGKTHAAGTRVQLYQPVYYQ